MLSWYFSKSSQYRDTSKTDLSLTGSWIILQNKIVFLNSRHIIFDQNRQGMSFQANSYIAFGDVTGAINT